ncbi:MAG: SpoIIE family protein phosphatase, partial [Oscillospiraceae bacterium]|nr:SpoIIE family protein phosphatase [Oscillospiraceae bacterium]
EADIYQNISVILTAFFQVLIYTAIFITVFYLIQKLVLNNIHKINEKLSEITQGNLDTVVDVRTHNEFEALSEDINETVTRLKQYIHEAEERIDKELEFAKAIQHSALPSVFPPYPNRKDLDIYATMHTAKEVGGDFYDFYFTDKNRLAFLIADVSGKGIPASLFMMTSKTFLKSYAENGLPVNEVLTVTNEKLCENNDAGMFVTAFMCEADMKTGLINFANAGHNPPIVGHTDGTFEYLKPRAGFVLAGMEGVRYRKQELQLQPGECLYLYTDGVTEATNSENELYGEQRLLSVLNSGPYEDMQSLCAAVKGDVDAFVGEAPQFDDITMLAFRYLGEPPVPTLTYEKAALEHIPEITEFIEAQLENMGCSMKTVFQINVAVDEICSNIIHYAYPEGGGLLTVKIFEKPNPRRVFIRFEDEGIPYNPLVKEAPDVTLSAEERDIGGLGIYIVKKTMDDVRYKYENEKNILTIIKNLDV